MDQRASAGRRDPSDRVRELGFHPEHLTPHERLELLDLHYSLSGSPGGPAASDRRGVESDGSTPPDGRR